MLTGLSGLSCVQEDTNDHEAPCRLARDSVGVDNSASVFASRSPAEQRRYGCHKRITLTLDTGYS